MSLTAAYLLNIVLPETILPVLYPTAYEAMFPTTFPHLRDGFNKKRELP